jgi:hypothetical protein
MFFNNIIASYKSGECSITAYGMAVMMQDTEVKDNYISMRDRLIVK